MQIDREEARRIAKLAHLEFDDEGLDRMAVEMTSILSYIDQLQEAGLAGDEAAGRSAAPLRDDTVVASIDRALVEANAPAFESGCFAVPKVIGGE